MLLLSAIISAILQVLVFTAIPFLVYLITYRRAKGFFNYIGLRKPERRTMLYAMILVVAFSPIVLLFFFLPNLREAATAPNTVIGHLRSLGFTGAAVIQLGLNALVQTSLSEEIFFRGFVAKRLINWLGFRWGNLLQALLFGSVHLLIFIGQTFSLSLAIFIVLFTSLVGWTFGYLNERVGNGSILPSWLVHGLSNAVAYGILAFG